LPKPAQKNLWYVPQNNQKWLLEQAYESLGLRKPISNKAEAQIVLWFRSLLRRCFKTIQIEANDKLYLRANKRLEKELDVCRVLKNMRYMRNALVYLTSKQERRLLKMQASQNVFDLRRLEKKPTNTIIQNGSDNSSDFASDFYQGEVREMLNKNTIWKLKLAPKELSLLQGIPLRMPNLEETTSVEGKILPNSGDRNNKVIAVDDAPIAKAQSPTRVPP
jgi:hypothetical protein